MTQIMIGNVTLVATILSEFWVVPIESVVKAANQLYVDDGGNRVGLGLQLWILINLLN